MAAKEDSIELPSNSFKGLLLNPSQIAVDTNAATLCSNVEKSDASQLTIRKGTRHSFRQTQTNPYNVIYPFTYTYHDIDSGSTVEELLGLGMSMDAAFAMQPVTLYKLNEQDLVITYVGAGTGRIQLYPEFTTPSSLPSPTQWRLTITANNVVVYNSALDMSGDDAITVSTLGDVVAAIHALADFNCSPTSISASAAQTGIDVLGPYVDVSFTNLSTEAFIYYDIETIGTGTDAPNGFTDANFTLPCALNYSNVVYFAYGTYEHKYDGRDFYRSGLPQADIDSVVETGTGTAFHTGDVYAYKIVHVRHDARGNVIESQDSDDVLDGVTATTKTVVAANTDLRVAILSLEPVNEPGFALKGAKINGTQTGINTITVDTGHTLEVDDQAYFYDDDSDTYVVRNVTAVAATTITVDGAVVGAVDNAYISNNVRTQIWRTKNNGTDFYFLEEIPNNAVSEDNFYTDDTPDTDLIEPYVEQLRKKSIPPKCSFLTEHQGLKVSSGDPEYPNRIRWSLQDDPEGYPLESNLTDIKGGGLGAVTAIGSVEDDVLAVFKRTGHALLDGSLDDLNFRTFNKANTGIGCTSFRSLTKIAEGDALIGLSLKGPFIFNGRTPSLLLAGAIQPIFSDANIADLQTDGVALSNGSVLSDYNASQRVNLPRSLERAIGFNDNLGKRYHLFIPAEIGTPGALKAVSFPSSKWLVYNYDPADLFWSEYTFYNRYRELSSSFPIQNINCSAGLTMYKNKLWYGMQSPRDSNSTLAGVQIRASLGYFKKGEGIYDYSDDSYPVYLDLFYVPFTRVAGSPSYFFKPLWIILSRFLTDTTADPADVDATVSFDPDFTLTVKSVLDHKQYNSNPYSTNAAKTFQATLGKLMMRIKAVTTKCRAFQIQVGNENADPVDFEQPAFDNIEFVYTTPYDKKSKEVKG